MSESKSEIEMVQLNFTRNQAVIVSALCLSSLMRIMDDKLGIIMADIGIDLVRTLSTFNEDIKVIATTFKTQSDIMTKEL